MNRVNKSISIFLTELFKSIIYGLIVFVFLYIFLWIDIVNSSNFVLYLVTTLIYSVTGYIFNKYLALYLNKAIPWNKYPVKRLIYGFILATILSIFIVLVVNILRLYFLYDKSVTEYITSLQFSEFKMPIYLTAIFLLVFYTIYFFKELQKTRLNTAKLQAENSKSKFVALKDQIDPHFLFNNLNVLYSIIDENPKNAKKFVKNLSLIYRYVLEQKEKDLITLDVEIDFAKKYLELLKFRFENSIFYDIRISNKESKIVSLALQTVLENAIKHNTITDNKPLKLHIYSEKDYLVVKNNINPLSSKNNSTKHGLNSLNERCKYLMNKEIIIENNSITFAVKIPLD